MSERLTGLDHHAEGRAVGTPKSDRPGWGAGPIGVRVLDGDRRLEPCRSEPGRSEGEVGERLEGTGRVRLALVSGDQFGEAI